MPAASAVIESDDVLVARIVSGLTTTSSSRKRSRLTAKSSTIASMTSPALTSAPTVCTTPMRAAAASAAARSILPFAASAANVSPIFALAWSAAPMRVSNRHTRWPAWAAICAMPAPMAPAPMTPTSVVRGSAFATLFPGEIAAHASQGTRRRLRDSRRCIPARAAGRARGRAAPPAWRWTRHAARAAWPPSPCVGACASCASSASTVGARSASSTHFQISPQSAACCAGSLSPSSASPIARAVPTRRGRK